MFTLYTLPNCPRCDMVKAKFDEFGIEYEIGTDEVRANEYSALFWPIMFGEFDALYQFPDILEVIAQAEQKHTLEVNPNFFEEQNAAQEQARQDELEGQATFEEMMQEEEIENTSEENSAE